jgi:hypothetical protein
MSSATGEDDVSMTAAFTQTGKEIHSDERSGKDSGGIVVLWSRTVFVGA